MLVYPYNVVFTYCPVGGGLPKGHPTRSCILVKSLTFKNTLRCAYFNTNPHYLANNLRSHRGHPSPLHCTCTDILVKSALHSSNQGLCVDMIIGLKENEPRSGCPEALEQ
jgi:hypothetical protein